MKIAEAYVELRVKSDQAKREAREAASAIAERTRNSKPTVEIGVDATKAVEGVRTFDERLGGLTGKDREIVLRANIKEAERRINEIDRKLGNDSLKDEEVRILVDQRKEAERRIDQIRDELHEVPKDGRTAAQELTKTFAQYFSAAVVVGELRKMTDAASNLQQAVGGTEAIFGKAADTIDRYARDSAQAMGLSERAFRELTSQIGGLLGGLGFTQQEAAATSVQLTQVGADLAAAFGGKPEEAVQALGAALRGEFDPLERFGVSLRQSAINAKAVEMGLAETTASVGDNARAQAALALITEQTANVQGQFGREAETAAGKQARFTAQLENQRAEIGEAMLPIYGALLESLGFVLDRFGELPGPAQTAIVAMVGIAAVAGPVKNAVEALGGLRRMLTSIPPQAAGVAAAVALAYVAYNGFTAKSREAERRTREVSDALIASRDAFRTAAEAAGKTATEVDDLAVAAEALSQALAQGDDGAALIQALGVLGLQGSDALDVLTDLQTGGVDAIRELGRAVGLTGDDLDTLVDYVTNYNDSAERSRLVSSNLGEQYLVVVDAIEELIDQSGKVDLERNAREFLNAEVAASELNARLVEQAEANTGLSRSGEGAIEVYTEYGRLMALNAAQTDEAAESTDDATLSLEEFQKRMHKVEDQTWKVTQVSGRLRDEYDEISDAADSLGKALDKVFGHYLDVDEATDALFESTDVLRETLEENGSTLDRNTEAGRANREQIRSQVDAIFAYAEANLRAGDSTQEAADKVLALTEGLRDQMLQAGFTESEVDAYLETLGLTPENVTTAIEIADDEIAKAKVEDYLESIEGLPAEVETEIRALIDEGAYRVAWARLQALTAPRDTYIPPAPRVGGQNPKYSASGRFVAGGSNLLTWVGERAGRGGDEVILPLGNRSRLAELLSDPRVGRPIGEMMPGASGGGTVVNVYPRGDVEVADVARALEMARLSR